MNLQFKLGLYSVMVVGSLLFGILFVRSWRRANETAKSAPVAESVTNRVADTGATGTNAAVQEPAPAEVTPEREPIADTARLAGSTRGLGRVMLWGFLGVGAVLGLASLIAYDVSQYAGQRATLALFDDEGEDLPESIDEQVEKAHGEGEFLEAIRLLRGHLVENPRAIHAQIRIAEIYEKDLHNPLAAALEYEEVLKQPFVPERRGWTAIHLVNLYNRLDKPEQAVALLKRIVVECPDTPAAVKARERLESAGIAVPESTARPASGGADSSSQLPPGFRPKGR